MRPLAMERDQLLTEAGDEVRFAYLPTSAIISVVAVMRDGRSVESRTIGREGGFGLLHALGSRLSFERVTVQCGGEAWRLPVDALAKAGRQSPTMVNAVVRHAQATLLQAAQNTACNALHAAEGRLCRWLLLTRERLASDVLPLTQEHLSIMLGVQRTTVTAIASQMQAKGMISYSRGKISLLDVPRIRACACECYEVIEAFAQRMTEERVGL